MSFRENSSQQFSLFDASASDPGFKRTERTALPSITSLKRTPTVTADLSRIILTDNQKVKLLLRLPQMVVTAETKTQNLPVLKISKNQKPLSFIFGINLLIMYTIYFNQNIITGIYRISILLCYYSFCYCIRNHNCYIRLLN